MNFVKRILRLIKKVFRYIRKHGLWKTAKRALRTISYRFALLNKSKRLRLINDLVDVNLFDTVIIFENNFGWNKIMKQRPQQIAENLPAGTLMFYHSHEDEDYEKGKRIRQIKNNLILVDLGYYRDILFEALTDHQNKYLMIYSTDFIPYERIHLYEEYRYKVIYEYVDDLNEELSGETYPLLLSRHRTVLTDPNAFVISTATNLKEKIEESGKAAALITNGVDYDHFKVADYPVPEDLKEIREKYDTVLCYYGALANWFDYDLMKKVARTGKYAVVLIGLDYDKTLGASGLLDEEHVFFLGRKSYDQLPHYGCNVDICIIPFLINDITESTSPVKLFEYMAMEKAIVTTALPECKKYESVFYSQDHDAFLANLEKAVAACNDPAYKKLLAQEALANTWSSKAAHLVEYVNTQHSKMLKEEIRSALEAEDYDRIIVWRSPFGWNVPLFQRPQHIARQFSKQRCLVFYEVTPKTDKVATVKKETDNLYLVNFENWELSQLLKGALEACNKPVYIQVYSTNWSMDMNEVQDYLGRGFKLLYEYIDDISPELSGTDEIPPYVLDKYNFAMSTPSVPVVTTATQLYEDVKSKRGETNMVYACNGVDYEFFQKLSGNFKYEQEFLDIVENGKINVCYYGALASWVDYELIRAIDRTGLYNLILIGIPYDDSFENSKVEKLQNVYFIGAKEYNVLKYYAAKMDTLIIPFVINSITQATNPLKLFEYMALHKPIVTTAMNECKKYQSVMIANTHQEFLDHLATTREKQQDKKYLELLDKEARENDWSQKAGAIIKLLAENENEN